MPEGHLVHHLARAHHGRFSGRAVLTTSPQGRFASEARHLSGRVLEEVDAFGKHLFYRWGSDVVHVHLGMQGKFIALHGTPLPEPRPQVRLRMATDLDAVDLVAPSRCALMDLSGRDEIIARLGPDPLRDDADPELAMARIARSERPIGVQLLDQSVIAGVGNVIRAEALFASRLHPMWPGSSLDRGRLGQLWQAIEQIMDNGMAEGRIITVRSGSRSPETLTEEEGRYVYKQAACRNCGAAIEMFALGGRLIYLCPVDQPPP